MRVQMATQYPSMKGEEAYDRRKQRNLCLSIPHNVLTHITYLVRGSSVVRFTAEYETPYSG